MFFLCVCVGVGGGGGRGGGGEGGGVRGHLVAAVSFSGLKIMLCSL